MHLSFEPPAAQRLLACLDAAVDELGRSGVGPDEAYREVYANVSALQSRLRAGLAIPEEPLLDGRTVTTVQLTTTIGAYLVLLRSDGEVLVVDCRQVARDGPLGDDHAFPPLRPD